MTALNDVTNGIICLVARALKYPVTPKLSVRNPDMAKIGINMALGVAPALSFPKTCQPPTKQSNVVIANKLLEIFFIIISCLSEFIANV